MTWSGLNSSPETALAKMEEAIENGADFSGIRHTESLLHYAATITPLSFFLRFLELAEARGFDINAIDQDGKTLLHKAARNHFHPDVAAYLIGRWLKTTTLVRHKYIQTDNKDVYSLFFGFNSQELRAILSQVLTEHQIDVTETRLGNYNNYLSERYRENLRHLNKS